MSFDRYFGVVELESSEEWIKNLYVFDLKKISDNVQLKADLIEPCSWNAIFLEFLEFRFQAFVKLQ